MNETGVILNYWKQLNTPDAEKNKIIRSFFSYVIDRKPSNSEYAMLFKLIKDFDYNIVFESLVSARYSTLDFSSGYWGYIVTVCRNMMKESISEDQDSQSVEDTKKLLTKIKSKIAEGS